MARIVVADDDDDIRELVVFTLRQSGHDVVGVADGASALVACERSVPDLVALDVTMPGMSGLEACLALRMNPDLASVPVILLSARSHASDIEQGFEAGADDYIVKPFTPRELALSVAAVLQGRRGRSGGGDKPGQRE